MSYMNFIMIGLLLREALDRLRVRLNMYFVSYMTCRYLNLIPSYIYLLTIIPFQLKSVGKYMHYHCIVRSFTKTADH